MKAMVYTQPGEMQLLDRPMPELAAGEVVLENAEGCLVRAGEGMTVVVVGGRNLAVIADREAVMVTARSPGRVDTEYKA